ncbi:hypothetical protein EAE99_006883 [Botrytis elliptica]|nr:hypothetical protein EAE99_006883 [Botrytis elliptica]
MDCRTPRHRTACDACKRMKIRCEWDQEGKCNRCHGREMECTVTTKERKKRERKKGNHISLLEDRLKRMEHAMTTSGLSIDASGFERQTSEEITDQAGMFEKFSALTISNTGSENFRGAASGFSMLSPEGLQLITRMTGNNDFANFMASTNYTTMNQYSVSSSIWHTMPDDEHKSLPPKEVADKILEFIFDRMMISWPLFERKTFMERYSRQYPVKCSEDPAWYACLNVCFALAAIMRKEELPGNSPPTPQNAKSPGYGELENLSWWRWLRNAASTFVDLQFGPPSLTAVQAMAGLAFILDTLSDPYPSSVVSAAAIRLAQTIGLHRNMSNSGLDEAEIEQRRNVFWIAVMIERGIVIRQGRPSVIHDEDIGVDLPPASQYPKNADGRFVTFRHNATLSLLQGRIYNRLYSAKSFTKSKTERLKMVGMLDDELQQWCETIPIEVRPGNPIRCDEHHIVSVVCMQWDYYQCLSTIHRASLYSGPGSLDDDGDKSKDDFDSKLNPRVYASAAICVNAARRTINLLEDCTKLSNPIEGNVLRMSIYNALAACVTLFANILQHPLDPQVQSDLQLMNDVVSFLSSFEDQGAAESHPSIPIFQEINRVAMEHVNKAQRRAPKNTKRSRAKSSNTEEPNTESDDSDDEDYRTEELESRKTVSEIQDPRSPTSPVNSANIQASPFSPAQAQPSNIPTRIHSFESNSTNYIPERMPTSIQQNYIIQQAAQIPQQSPPFYESSPRVQLITNLSDLDQQQQHINSLDYHNSPIDPRLQSQSYPSQAYTHTSHPATGYYFSSSDQHQHQHQQNISSHHSETYTNTLSNPHASPQDLVCQEEETLLPQDGSWFFPMISPWPYGDGSNVNLNGVGAAMGGVGENEGGAWRHGENDGEGDGLGGWSVHG